MNFNKLTLFLLITGSLFIVSCKQKSSYQKTDYYKLADNNVPGLEAKIFAPDIFGKSNRFEQYCSFSPDGKEFYYSVTDSAWGKSVIYKMAFENPTKPQRITLIKSDYQSGQFIDFSGKRLFFTAIQFSGGMWHTDIYMVEKKGDKWGKPFQFSVPVNSYICEWHPTLTKTGIMYFASERGYDHGISDIYRALPDKKGFGKVEKLPESINTEYNETDPLIAHDESFIIFASNRPGGVSGHDMYNRPNGYDEQDLYISFNLGENNWSEARNMGDAVNTDSWEFAPALSPDGKYLFFTRRETFKTLNPSKIFWVDAEIINHLKD